MSVLNYQKVLLFKMEINCKVHEVGVLQQVSETFKKRDLIVEYAENPTYPEYIKFEALQDKCEKLDELRPGDDITVHFNLRGRPWTNKEGVTSYFNSLVIWRFDVNKTTSVTKPPVDLNKPSGEDDDLPF